MWVCPLNKESVPHSFKWRSVDQEIRSISPSNKVVMGGMTSPWSELQVKVPSRRRGVVLLNTNCNQVMVRNSVGVIIITGLDIRRETFWNPNLLGYCSVELQSKIIMESQQRADTDQAISWPQTAVPHVKTTKTNLSVSHDINHQGAW